MVLELPFRLTNGSGDLIRGDLRWSEQGGTPKTLLILCHGFTAHKDWGLFPYAGGELAERGFATAVFNFSHNGIGENPKRFTDIDRFEKNTVSKELEDLLAVIRTIAGIAGDEGCAIDDRRFGVIGHSRGAGIALLGARREPRIAAVAGWASIATFYRYTEHQRTMWDAQGYLPVTIRGSKTRLRYGRGMLADLESHREEYDLVETVRHLGIPLLLVHGTADVSVKPREPEDLYASADPSKTRLIMLEGAGHAFGASHPFTLPAPVVDRVIGETADWFALNLMAGHF
jgi:pimeloyl-ACP methyl ester carboxylesterase